MSGIPAGAGSLLGKRLGKYEILALLALGGTAEIYLARIDGAAGFEKYVVVKCLHDHLADDTEFVKMFLDEARLAAHLDHSNIVQTMELGEYENRYYMVMEFLAGLSLAMVIRRGMDRLPNGRLPVPLVLNVLAQAAAGLHYAHDKAANGKPLQIVHRDISPQNLVISFEGVVKVVDFGIAKAELRETRTRSGTIKGKFAYMSPEQCVANNVDRRTDVFALGVIAHELLTGRRLFKKNSPYETYQAVLECAVPRPSKLNHELDPALDEVVMPAVAKDRERRYQTAEAFGDALLGYLHHRGKGSGPSDVARFFDATFTQEIEEHGMRMRELISGRELRNSGMGWGEEDEKEQPGDSPPTSAGQMTVDLGPRRADAEPEMLDTGDLIESSTSGLSDVISGLTADRASTNSDASDGGEASDDDESPADRTRIEANPLERVEELNKIADKQRGAAPVMPPSGALPLPAPPTLPVHTGVPTAPPDRPTPAAPIVPAKPRISEIVNMPTQLAPAEVGELLRERGPDAATEVAKPVAPVAPGWQAAPPAQPWNPAQPPASFEYPVMSRELRDQIATGATVFPSDARPSAARIGAHEPHPPGALAHDSGPRASIPGSGPQVFPRPGEVISPFGANHEPMDWAAAAAVPARAVPRWKLVLLFVGALGFALLITLLIAAIAR